jgi:hypothetical protein
MALATGRRDETPLAYDTISPSFVAKASHHPTRLRHPP